TSVASSDDPGVADTTTTSLPPAPPATWTDNPSGSWPSKIGIEQAQGNSGVVTTVSRTPGAVTYADDSLVDKTLGKGKLLVGDSFVEVSGAAASIAVSASTRVEGRHQNDIALELDRNTTKPGAYPLVLVSYLVLCSGYADSNTVELVQTFGDYIVREKGQQVASDSAKSAPMPKSLAEEAHAAI